MIHYILQIIAFQLLFLVVYDVFLKIDNTGKAVDVKAKAAFSSLEQEAVRVISNLPQMLPGEQDGKLVGVLYSLPIIFDIKSE